MSRSGQRRATRVAIGLTIAGGALLVASAGIWVLGVIMGFGAYGNQDYEDRSADVAFVAAKVVFVTGALLTPIAAMAAAATWTTDGDGRTSGDDPPATG